MISRRELIELALAGPVLANVQPAAAQSKLDRRTVMAAQGAVVAADGCRPQSVDLIREWSAGLCQSRIVNRGKEPVRLKEVLLFDLPMALPPETHLYGEGFQMLSQTGGTLAKPEDYSQYTDIKHYRLPTPAGTRSYYGVVMLTPPESSSAAMLAFTSATVTDVWTGESLGKQNGSMSIDLLPRSAKLLECRS